jgi:hypothetical protein
MILQGCSILGEVERGTGDDGGVPTGKCSAPFEECHKELRFESPDLGLRRVDADVCESRWRCEHPPGARGGA